MSDSSEQNLNLSEKSCRLGARPYLRSAKVSQFAGRVRPSAASVVRVIAKHNRETIQVHGAEAVRSFSLRTQVQTKPVFYTSGSSREVKTGQSTVRLLHVSPEKLQHAGTKVGLALSALFYLGKEGVNGRCRYQSQANRLRIQATCSQLNAGMDAGKGPNSGPLKRGLLPSGTQSWRR
ncbi:DUF6088 family protein [Pseudomonas sp. H11T01]|uniref:DUF6088 family protein n=1 Tax=Pseudomonas sp. H11T01 TaxID=3402749 RepID=UPI003AC1DA0D